MNSTTSIISQLSLKERSPISNRNLAKIIKDHTTQTIAFLASVQNTLLKNGVGQHGAINCGRNGTNFIKISESFNKTRRNSRRTYKDVTDVIQFVFSPIDNLLSYQEYRRNENSGECTTSKIALNRCINQIAERTYMCTGIVIGVQSLENSN